MSERSELDNTVRCSPQSGEPYDRELRDALWHASGDDCDTADAFVVVEARVRRIRRRRMDIAGLALLGALVVALGVAWQGRDHGASQRPASEATSTLAATTTVATTVAPAAPPATAAPSTETAPPAPIEPAAPATDETAPDAAPPQMAPANTSPATDAPEATTHDPAPAAAPPADTRAPRSEQTFSATGGRLTVRVADGGLSFVSASARTGYTAGAPVVSGESVVIDFTSRRGDSRIRVALVDGHLVPTISFDDGGHDRRPGRTSSTSAAPTPTTATTDPSNDGGGTHWGDRSGRS